MRLLITLQKYFWTQNQIDSPAILPMLQNLNNSKRKIKIRFEIKIPKFQHKAIIEMFKKYKKAVISHAKF